MISVFKLGLSAAVFIGGVGLITALASLSIQAPVPRGVGPWLAPFAISVLLVVMSLVLAVQAVDGTWRCEAAQTSKTPTAIMPILWLAGGVIADILVIKPLGFIPAAAILFVATARAFGSRSLLLNLAAGIALAAIIEFCFVRLLGIDLGDGLISLAG